MNLFEGLKSDWIYINGFRRIIGAVGKFDPEAAYTLADAIEDAVEATWPELEADASLAFEGSERAMPRRDELRARYVGPMVRGEMITSYCLTEPDNGSDAATIS